VGRPKRCYEARVCIALRLVSTVFHRCLHTAVFLFSRHEWRTVLPRLT